MRYLIEQVSIKSKTNMFPKSLLNITFLFISSYSSEVGASHVRQVLGPLPSALVRALAVNS